MTADEPVSPRQPGPRLPPRPAGTAPAPAPGRPPSASGPRRSESRGPRLPIPQAPGPRPEPSPLDRPVRADPTPVVSAVTFREVATTTPASDRSFLNTDVAADLEQVSESLQPPVSPQTAFRSRYGVVYDTQGPRIRLGVLWFVLVVAALALEPLRPYGLATLYAVVAGAAALQVVDAWHTVRTGADRWVAALGASSLPVLATLGVRPLGAAMLGIVVAAVGVAAAQGDAREMPLFAAAGHTVLAAGVCGGSTAALVLLADYEIGAVIILLVFLMVYDASDYLVGSGATNGVEGPIAGGLFIAAVTMLFVVTKVPPFRGVDIVSFAMLAVLACPAGQLLASAMLPRAGARAPALRRLDSLLILAPAWAGLIGLYLQNAVR